MPYAEKRGDYWRARYWLPDGALRTVSDASGAAVRYGSQRDAERAAMDAESKARSAGRDPTAGRMKFGEFVSRLPRMPARCRFSPVLDQRRAMAPRSSVALLDRLLAARRKEVGE